jgi:transposase
MTVLHEQCAGLDVHKQTVVACRRVMAGAQVAREVRSFPTTTRGLLALADWLREAGCRQVAMESTGVYWKPVWHMLAGEFELVLANAAHIKNVPGRKSDMNDATWIADLLAHGLIRSSFVPPAPIQELRDLTRTRKQLVREAVQHKQRIQKVLEDANVKLDSVVSDLLGASGRRMLRAMIAGEENPAKLAALGNEQLSASRETLAEALHGRVTRHHRFLLKQHLDMVEHLEKTVGEFEAQIEAALQPFRAVIERLVTIPGVSATAASVIVAEIGADMKHFPTVGHLISWAGLCPGLNQSAGKVKSRTLRNGAPWLKTVLVQSAWAASRKQDGYLRSQFLRIKSRRGPKKAIMAVAASILTAAYHLVRDPVPYKELGPVYLLRLDHERTAARLTQRLRNLGYEVEIKKAAA